MSDLFASLHSDRNRKTTPTRQGSKHIKAVAQSYEGSISVEIFIEADGTHRATLRCEDGSTQDPRTFIWEGDLAKLIQKFKSGPIKE